LFNEVEAFNDRKFAPIYKTATILKIAANLNDKNYNAILF